MSIQEEIRPLVPLPYQEWQAMLMAFQFSFLFAIMFMGQPCEPIFPSMFGLYLVFAISCSARYVIPQLLCRKKFPATAWETVDVPLEFAKKFCAHLVKMTRFPNSNLIPQDPLRVFLYSGCLFGTVCAKEMFFYKGRMFGLNRKDLNKLFKENKTLGDLVLALWEARAERDRQHRAALAVKAS